MPSAILIIEPSESNRQIVKGFLGKLYHNREVELYDPVLQGKPSPAFAWSNYDLVIMDTRLGGTSGLEWLAEFRDAEDFPPVLFLSSDSKVDTAVKAMKLGARDYLLKKGLRYGRFKHTVAEILPLEPKPEAEADGTVNVPDAESEDFDGGQTQILPETLAAKQALQEAADAGNDAESEDFDGSQTQVLPETLAAKQLAQKEDDNSGGYNHYDTQVLPAAVNLTPQETEQINGDAINDTKEDLPTVDHYPDVRPIPEDVQDEEIDQDNLDATQELPESGTQDPYIEEDTVPTSQENALHEEGVDIDSHLGDTQILPQAELTKLQAENQQQDAAEELAVDMFPEMKPLSEEARVLMEKYGTSNKDPSEEQPGERSSDTGKQQYWDEDTQVLFVDPEKDS